MEYFIDDVWGEDTLKRRLGSKNDLDELAPSAPLLAHHHMKNLIR